MGSTASRRRASTVEIGALARHAQAERSDTIAQHAPLIARAMPHIGHAAIRNRGTLGGSIAFADPAAELPACLLALDGEVGCAGPKGKRTVKADDFFKGLFETALGPQDMLTAIRVPAATRTRASALPNWRAGTATTPLSGWPPARAPTAKACKDVRLAYFGVGATPVRAKKVGSRAGRRRCRCRGRRARSRSRMTTCRRPAR